MVPRNNDLNFIVDHDVLILAAVAHTEKPEFPRVVYFCDDHWPSMWWHGIKVRLQKGDVRAFGDGLHLLDGILVNEVYKVHWYQLGLEITCQVFNHSGHGVRREVHRG